jgi:hypothetical protein
MLTPSNYVDLFDRLYPEQHLLGLTDDGQITTEELNRRFATIRANQRTMMLAMNGVYAAASEGAHFRDFMLPFWEVAFSKKFVIGETEYAALRYIDGYDPAGLRLTFPETRIALYANDCGSQLFEQDIEFMVFSDGLLVSPNHYDVHLSQGGFAVYLKESQVQIGTVIRLVALRKFNERGVTFERFPMPGRPTATAPLPDGTPTAQMAFKLSDLGHVHDVRYYRLFAKRDGDGYFRPVPRSNWKALSGPGYEMAFVGITGEYTSGYQMILVDAAEFWKYEITVTVDPHDSIWKIDLVDSNGYPLPVCDTKDVDVWAKGRKLRAGVDYWVEFGSHLNPGIPPRIVFNDIYYGDVHLYAVSNVPYEAESSIEVDVPALPGGDSLVRMSPQNRRLRLMENVGMVFSCGRLELAGDGIETVADNLALHFMGLRDKGEFVYRARFVFGPEMFDAAIVQSEAPSVLERFARTVGAIQPNVSYASMDWYNGDFRDGAAGSLPYGGVMDFRDGKTDVSGKADYREGSCKAKSPCDTAAWDLIEIHRRGHPTLPVPAGVLPVPDRDNFPAAYFWLRDEFNLASVEATVHEQLLPWRQGDDVLMDCREQNRGPAENVSLDARGGYVAVDTYVGYTSGAFTDALGGEADFRDGAMGAPDGWERDTADNGVMDFREQEFWRSPNYDVMDFRTGETYVIEGPNTIDYPSAAFVDAVGAVADVREGSAVPAALAPWTVDEAGNVIIDGRDLLYYGVSQSAPMDGREAAT